MDFNFDTGAISGGLQSLDVTTLPPLGGQAGVLTILGSGAITLPQGTTLAQPVTPAAGMFRYNSDTTLLEYYNGTVWSPLSTSSSTVTSVAANSNSTGLTVGGSPITSAGTLQFTLSDKLEELSAFSGTGIVAHTAADEWSAIEIVGTVGNIVVTNGTGNAGNPTINLATVTLGAGTDFVKLDVDTYGRVIGATSVTAADIGALVDTRYVNVSGDAMDSAANLTFSGGGEVLGLPLTPSSANAAVSKAYVDSLTQGLSWKQAARLATVDNIPGFSAGTIEISDSAYFPTVGGPAEIDGVPLATGDRIIVKNQANLNENGIYVVTAPGAQGDWPAILVRADDMNVAAEFDGSAAFVQEGDINETTAWVETATVTVVNTSNVVFAQFSGAGAYTGGAGIDVSGNIISLQTPVDISNGGTGSTSAPANGQILIGNGTGYSLATISNGAGISVTSGSGAITIANTGVTSVAGTTNQIAASAATGAVTLSVPSAFVAPGSVEVTTSLTVQGLDEDGFMYVGAGKEVMTTSAATNGQLLIGSTSNSPVKGTLTAGTGIVVTNGAGSITIAADTSALVTSFSAGSTGLLPSSATTGNVVLTGTLATANGGTGLTTIGSSNQLLAINVTGTALEYKTIAAGTGITVSVGAGLITIDNTGVTSVAMTLPSSVFSVAGSPVTGAGTLAGTFVSQAANTVFAAPDGAAGVPTFRALTATDLGTALQLYKENPVSPTAPSSTGNNAVAIGSGATATVDESFAVGKAASPHIYGGKAFANGSNVYNGDAQHGVYVLRNVTTNATLTELFLDGASGARSLVLPVNSLFTFEILVAARRSDAAGGGAGYRFTGVARKDTTNGSITFVGTPSKTVLGETDTAWDAAVSVNTTNGSLRVRVTGQASKDISWVATVLTTEVLT
jgi:hypothetical protein